jgi:hypothetical protein
MFQKSRGKPWKEAGNGREGAGREEKKRVRGKGEGGRR